MPISAQLKYNIDAVNQFIVNYIPVPMRDFTASPRLIVIRSFDVNKPGADVDELKGGVAGGSILTGVLRLVMRSRLDLVSSKMIKERFNVNLYSRTWFPCLLSITI